MFKTHADLDDDSLQSIKHVYFKQMKPAVSEEQLVAAATVFGSSQGVERQSGSTFQDDKPSTLTACWRLWRTDSKDSESKVD